MGTNATQGINQIIYYYLFQKKIKKYLNKAISEE